MSTNERIIHPRKIAGLKKLIIDNYNPDKLIIRVNSSVIFDFANVELNFDLYKDIIYYNFWIQFESLIMIINLEYDKAKIRFVCILDNNIFNNLSEILNIDLPEKIKNFIIFNLNIFTKEKLFFSDIVEIFQI